MLPTDSELARLLQSSHEAYYLVEASRGPNITLPVVPVTSDGSLSFSGDADVQCTGSVFLAKADGSSLIPKSKTDPLAPYGQELRITRVDVGTKEFLTPMGRLRISDVPSAREYFRRWPNGAKLIGWAAQLQLVDRFEAIRADEFLYPDAPQSGRTTWQEIQRLSPFPILISPDLPDRDVPGGLAYPDSRLEALTLLFANLGGYPHMTREGVLTGRIKDAWLTQTEPAFEISGVIDMDDSLSNKLYNSVRVKSSAGNNDLVAVREITDPGNPINVMDMGRRVYTQSSPLYETQSAVDAAAETILARVSTRQAKTVKVTCLPHPELELGDFGKFVDPISEREVVGEITKMNFSLDAMALMTVELIAAETR